MKIWNAHFAARCVKIELKAATYAPCGNLATASIKIEVHRGRELRPELSWRSRYLVYFFPLSRSAFYICWLCLLLSLHTLVLV